MSPRAPRDPTAATTAHRPATSTPGASGPAMATPRATPPDLARVDVDEARGAHPVGLQRPREALARRPRAPHPQRQPRGRHPRREEGRLRREDLRRGVPRVGEGEPPRTMPPRDERLGQLLQAHARGVHAQPEVVVFGHGEVAPGADGVEGRAAQHHRRVAHRRLDKHLPRVIVGRDERVLPRDVFPQPLARGVVGEAPHAHVATRSSAGVRVEVVALPGDARGVADVVGVHARDEVAAGAGEAHREGADDAEARRVEGDRPAGRGARGRATYAGPSSREPSLMTINSRAGSGSAQRPARASGSVGPQSR
jgi:hypothetical protein